MIQFDNIGLRAPEPYDVQKIFEWENDQDHWDSSSIVSSYSFHNIEEYVNGYDPDIFATRQLRFMIVDLLENGKTVGMIDIFDFDPVNRRAMTGFYVERPYRSKGICTRALTALKLYCRQRLAMHQLSAVAAVDNCPSISALENAGFKVSGKLRDWICRQGQFVDAVIMQCILD